MDSNWPARRELSPNEKVSTAMKIVDEQLKTPRRKGGSHPCNPVLTGKRLSVLGMSIRQAIMAASFSSAIGTNKEGKNCIRKIIGDR